MSILRILIGLPGSGKSTYCKNFSDWVINSSDAIREELTGDAENQSVNDKVFELMFKRTVAALKENKDVIYDATNLNRRKRVNLIKSIKQSVKEDIVFEAIVFAIPYKTCLQRNSNRDRVVPEEVIKRMVKSFEPPYYCEGFKNIEIIQERDYTDYASYYILNQYIYKECNISHDNPHHKLNIKEHLLAAEHYARENFHNMVSSVPVLSMNTPFLNSRTFKDIAITAARCHDIGKPFCKVFHNMRNEETKIAHYYNHENVSSYIYLCYCDKINTYFHILVANLISNHMVFFTHEMNQEKRKKLYGETFWTLLSFVHECDLAAH